MEYKVTTRLGPLSVEIVGENREEIETELLNLAEFVEGNEDSLGELPVSTPPTPTRGTTQTETGVAEVASGPRVNGSLFGSIPTTTRVPEDVLAQLFDIPDDEEEPPFLILHQFEEGVDVLGSHRNQKQAQGSVLLLYLWQECREVETVEKEELDRGLSYSDIDIERRDAMGQAFGDDARKWFEHDGDKIKLTTPGEHQARQLIKELAEKI